MSLMRRGNAKDFIRYLTDSKLPFTLITSNYTIKIMSEVCDKKFVRNNQSNRTFAAFAKLKSDVKTTPIPRVDMGKLKYFVHDLGRNQFHPFVYNIDLKSAYATILYNDGLITEPTYRYLSKINKNERLAAVGMLASRKSMFLFRDGEPIDSSEEVSEFAPFFFYAVQRTAEIMNQLKAIIGRKYLFTWVDGIYFTPDDDTLLSCMEYLGSINFPFTFDKLKDFDVRLTDMNTRVFFIKDGKQKLFNLPHALTDFKKTTIDAIVLLNTKIKKDETRSRKTSK